MKESVGYLTQGHQGSIALLKYVKEHESDAYHIFLESLAKTHLRGDLIWSHFVHCGKCVRRFVDTIIEPRIPAESPDMLHA